MSFKDLPEKKKRHNVYMMAMGAAQGSLLNIDPQVEELSEYRCYLRDMIDYISVEVGMEEFSEKGYFYPREENTDDNNKC